LIIVAVVRCLWKLISGCWYNCWRGEEPDDDGTLNDCNDGDGGCDNDVGSINDGTAALKTRSERYSPDKNMYFL